VRWLWLGALVAVAACLLWQAWQQLFVTEETRVRRAVAAMENAIEENKIVALADCIAGSYSDEHGLDKPSLLGAIRSVRQQYAAMFIHITDMKIEVAPDNQTAQATLVAKVLTKAAGGGQTEVNAERVRLYFRKTDGGWKLARVESPELKFD